MLQTTITIPQTFKVTHEQFQQIAVVNRDLRLERTATGTECLWAASMPAASDDRSSFDRFCRSLET